MTKDEFILKRLEEDQKLYSVLFWVYLATLAAFLIMCVIGFFMGKAPMSLGGVLIIASVALSAPNIMHMRDDDEVAVKEYRAYLESPDRDESQLSEATMRALRTLQTSSKSLLGMAVAYGIVALMMVIGGFIIVFVASGEVGLIIAGCILLVMAIILGMLSFRAFGSHRIAKELGL